MTRSPGGEMPATDPQQETGARHLRFAVVPARLWLIVAWRWTRPGQRFITLAAQRRVAWPPATPQTRHYSLMASESHGLTAGTADV